MLSRSVSLAIFALALVGAAGCKTTSTDTDTPVSTTSGAGGGDGTGGTDGTGGSDGSTGGSSSSGEGGSAADGCGVDTGCWADEASSCGAEACESAELYFQCPATGDYTDAYYTCTIASQIYRENIWANLVDCLRDNGADIVTQCDDGQANTGACVEQAYANACANEDSDALCAGAATACAEGEDDNFTLAQCEADMVVMSAAGLDAYADCFDANADVACADIHDFCYFEITAL